MFQAALESGGWKRPEREAGSDSLLHFFSLDIKKVTDFLEGTSASFQLCAGSQDQGSKLAFL